LQDGNWGGSSPADGGSPEGRSGAVVFVIGGYAYFGTGVDESNTRHNDFYRFDPSNSSWYQAATCTGMTPRSSSVAFATNGKGYVGTGYDGSYTFSDFWQYNPVSNSWLQVASLGDSNGLKPRYDAVAFGIDAVGSGYVSTGNDGSNYLNDFWQYDLISNSWKKRNDFPGYQRTQAVAYI